MNCTFVSWRGTARRNGPCHSKKSSLRGTSRHLNGQILRSARYDMLAKTTNPHFSLCSDALSLLKGRVPQGGTRRNRGSHPLFVPRPAVARP
jgi:hypothetical protein